MRHILTRIMVVYGLFHTQKTLSKLYFNSGRVTYTQG